MSPSTTRRRVGATEITRNSRRMRSARKTESPWAAGTSAMATMTKSKLFQPSRENCQRGTTILAASSNTEIVRHAASNASTRGPARAIMTSEVSTPGTMALNRMTPRKKDRKCRCSIRFSKRARSGKANVPGMDQRKSSIWALVRAASRPRPDRDHARERPQCRWSAGLGTEARCNRANAVLGPQRRGAKPPDRDGRGRSPGTAPRSGVWRSDSLAGHRNRSRAGCAHGLRFRRLRPPY